MNDPNLAPPPASITPSDIFYTLFRHKWKILFCTLAGVVAAAALYFLLPKSYSSQARLFIRYIEQGKSPTTGEGGNRLTLETRGDSVINSELQIITSMDLALQIAEKLGAESILGDPEKRFEQAEAAKAILDSLRVSVPSRSSVISIEYTHPNRSVVQPVLQGLIDAYLAKHLETRSEGSFDSFVNQQAEQYRSRLSRTENELRDALNRAGVISLEEAKADQNSKIASIKGALLDSKAELAARQAALDEMRKLLPKTPSTTDDSVDPSADETPQIDPGTIQSYASVQARLDLLRRREQDLLTRYTLENPLVKGVQTQIAEAESQKVELELQNPILSQTIPTSGSSLAGMPPSNLNLSTASIQAIALESKINVLEAQYLQIQKDAARISAVETEINQLNRRKLIEEQNFRYFSESREQAKIDEAFGAGRVNNIGIVQQPTPPFSDPKSTYKYIGGALVACVAFGIAWAFLIELVLDQSVKRPIDVKRALDIPLFLSIPDSRSRAYRKLLKKTGKQDVLRRAKRAKSKPSKDAYHPKSSTLIAAAKSSPGDYAIETSETTEASPWDSDHALLPYYEALRDRLIGFFEGRNLVHKPKLIGLTGLGEDPGVTTIASGLASTLSKTGEGNVLLVDMTLGQESAQQFYEGKAISDLEELLDMPKNGSESAPENRLTVAAEGSNGFKLPKILPNRFNDLVPKLKASDFDYIIFDMPAVSPISVTPRLASFMDAVLLVIESEKANKEIVQRATELLGKTNANVGAILNKTKNYVPQRLQEEYLGDL